MPLIIAPINRDILALTILFEKEVKTMYQDTASRMSLARDNWGWDGAVEIDEKYLGEEVKF